MSEPKNCIKCEWCKLKPTCFSERAYQCTKIIPEKTIVWTYTKRVRITPPAWCPLRQEVAKC